MDMLSDRSYRAVMEPLSKVDVPTSSWNDRKAATRSQIGAAASDLFLRRGFTAVTMEEIARAAAIQRSTLYTHFRDKDAILSEIAEQFIPDVLAVIATLPGPVPTADEVLHWVERFAALICDQPVPAELLLSTGHLDVLPSASHVFGRDMMKALAERLTAFSRAMLPGETFLLAWAHATLRELAYAVTYFARSPADPMSRDRLRVAASLLARFARLEV